jgi:hypothetical protein
MNNYNISELVNKYSYILELIPNHKIHGNLALLFEISSNYIKNKFKNVDIEIKVSAVYVIKQLYVKGLISSDNDCEIIINDFMKYYYENYNSFINEFDNNINKYEINMLFIKNFLNKI